MKIEHRKLTPELFQPADIAGLESERISRPPVGFWRDSWIRLRKHRGALISLAVLIFLFFMAFLLGPLLSWHSPYGVDVARAYEAIAAMFPQRIKKLDGARPAAELARIVRDELRDLS